MGIFCKLCRENSRNVPARLPFGKIKPRADGRFQGKIPRRQGDFSPVFTKKARVHPEIRSREMAGSGKKRIFRNLQAAFRKSACDTGWA